MIARTRKLALSTAALLLVAGTPVLADVPADCTDLDPQPAVDGRLVGRAITPEDLLRLRDVGWPASVAPTGPAAISVAPDGRSVAFQIRRVDQSGERYCLGMFVASLVGRHEITQIDSGGEFIRLSMDRTGITAFPTGVAKVITPHWSPNGRWIAYLKQTQGVTQIWRARANGQQAEQISSSRDHVEDLRWTRDGKAIIFASRPALRNAWHRIEEEGKTGFRYDERFVPKASSRPFPQAPIIQAYFALDVATRIVRLATSDEINRLKLQSDAAKPANARLFAQGEGKARAWTSPRSAGGVISIHDLHVETASGQKAICASDACRDIVGLWWPSRSSSLLFLRREGWGNSQLALYRWTPGRRSEPERLFSTPDMLASCDMVIDKLLCLHEASNSPARLIFVSLDGTVEPVVDLNPEIARLTLSPVHRRQWRNAMGVDTFGDLVLPYGYDGKHPLPLVIVQYDSRGFLRGGTGDEYPIQAFAAHGFAVLSFERPRFTGMSQPAKDGDELFRHNLEDWKDLRSVLSSLDIIIDQLVREGIVDPAHMGIAGLSDGTRNIQYALVNSDRFAAASVSSSFEEPGTFIPLAGPAGASSYVASGYPGIEDDAPDFWHCYSLVRNAAKLRTPVLMQLSDDEYLGNLEPLAAFRSMGLPSALYIFPNEHHIKWQPRHRLSVYYRNIAWFEHWLQPARSSRLAMQWLGPQIAGSTGPDRGAGHIPAPDQCRAQASASASASTRK